MHRLLYDLLRGDPSSGRSKKKKCRTRLEFFLGPNQQSAFDRLVELLTSAPVLAYADFTKPFILDTDASQDG